MLLIIINFPQEGNSVPPADDCGNPTMECIQKCKDKCPALDQHGDPEQKEILNRFRSLHPGLHNQPATEWAQVERPSEQPLVGLPEFLKHNNNRNPPRVAIHVQCVANGCGAHMFTCGDTEEN